MIQTSPISKAAVLLPNIEGFPAPSMVRYARELETGLREIAGEKTGGVSWNITALDCRPSDTVRKWVPGGQGEKMASRWGRFVAYPRMASAAQADVFHVLDHSHANLTRSLPGEKTVITCHDIIPYLAALGKIPMQTSRLTRWTFPKRIEDMKRCRFIIADSLATKNDLMEYGGVPDAQIVVVYCGLGPVFAHASHASEADTTAHKARAAQTVRTQYGLPPTSQVVFHLGTGTRYKNTPALLYALAQLRKHNDGAYLLRAGAPFFEDEQALVQSLGLEKYVVHTGRIPTDDALADVYRAADVLAFPSLYEGFGWPPLEAMACGTPVVTSNAASLPEVVGDAGLMVPPTDHDALADALRRVLGDAALAARLGREGRQRAQQFSWQRCARETLAVYKNVLSVKT